MQCNADTYLFYCPSQTFVLVNELNKEEWRFEEALSELCDDGGRSRSIVHDGAKCGGISFGGYVCARYI
jgi:hypothetical protein